MMIGFDWNWLRSSQFQLATMCLSIIRWKFITSEKMIQCSICSWIPFSIMLSMEDLSVTFLMKSTFDALSCKEANKFAPYVFLIRKARLRQQIQNPWEIVTLLIVVVPSNWIYRIYQALCYITYYRKHAISQRKRKIIRNWKIEVLIAKYHVSW